MTDLPFSDDELLSSFLDGELTDEERSRVDARLAAEPELAAQLDGLRAAAVLAATPVAPLRIGDTDRLIAAAIAASDTTATVTDLAASRAQRTNPWRGRLIGAAAAVALLAIGIPALQSVDWSGDDADTAETADAGDDTAMDTAALGTQAADDTMEMADDAALVPDAMGGDAFNEDPAADGSEATGFAALQEPSGEFDPLRDELGFFSDLDALRDNARIAWSAGDPSTTDDEDRATSSTITPAPAQDAATYENSRAAAAAYLEQYGGCGSAIDTLSAFPYTASPVAVDYATATIGGEPVAVGLVRLADGTGVLIVLDTETCTVRYDEALVGP